MKRTLTILLSWLLLVGVNADQVIFQPTSYSPPASLTIDAGVGLYGIWDFTGATVLGLPASGGLPVGGTTNQVLAKKSATDYDTQWVTPSTGTGGGTPGGADTQVQFNDAGAFGGDSAFTFNKSTKALKVTGDLLLDATGNNMTTPRVFGIGTWQGGSAAQMQFGDYVNCFQALYGGRMQLVGYWGLEIYGGWQSASHVTFHAGDTHDPSVNILGNTAANTVLAVTGATSQTGNLQEWRDVGPNVLANIGPTGSMNFVSGARIRWSSFPDNANGGIDTGIGRNTVGVMEVDNGTAGTFADLKVKNLIASGAVTGNGSVPTGGGTGQVLGKNTATNYDLGWITPPTGSGLPTGGNTGQLLTKKSAANGDAQWSDPKVTTRVIFLTTPGSGTYTPSNAGCKALFVECMGGGGGSAGALGTATPSSASSGGGGAGSYSCKYILGVAVNYAYVVGAGGTAGAATPTAGGNGGDTTFGATTPVTGSAGLGSPVPSAGTSTAISGRGGAPSGDQSTCNCDLYMSGQPGFSGMRYNNAGAPTAYGGYGGSSHWGGGPWNNSAPNAGGISAVGWGYGVGASGAHSINATGQAGASGAGGAIRITEIY